MYIDGMTKIAGLIGDPIMYSQSPAMHNAAFAYLQLPIVYLPLSVKQEDVPAAIQAIRAFQLVGVNVTVPHKETVMPYLDCIDATAERCGAVNTIVNKEGKLTGYNTDGLGFIDSLLEAGFRPEGKNAVILGAGGSARAVAAALLDHGAKSLTLLNRTIEKAEQLAAALGVPDNLHIQPLLPKSSPDLTGTHLVVNTLSTSFKTNDMWLLDLTSAKGSLFYDLRYGKMPSAYLDYAKELNSPGLDGLGMLLHQGARAFTLFTGKPAPVEVMRSALKRQP